MPFPSRHPANSVRARKGYTYVFVSETNYEFYMNDTIANNNTQHGVYLENIRNYVMVNASTISYNGYGAGLCVYGGAGTNSS